MCTVRAEDQVCNLNACVLCMQRIYLRKTDGNQRVILGRLKGLCRQKHAGGNRTSSCDAGIVQTAGTPAPI